MKAAPAVSIVIPAYNESDNIQASIARIARNVNSTFEIIVVVDSPEDTTIPAIAAIQPDIPQVRVEIQESRGPAEAIKFGFGAATAPVVIVTMADGSDDPGSIDTLVELVDRGCVIAAASRYMPGGQQIGGPRFKAFLSRSAGRSLKYFAGVTTSDATNSYKAYSRQFVEEVGIESDAGFEIALELVAKARRLRKPIAEIPTIWLDRDAGESRFLLKKWLPKYLKWYRFAYGPALTLDQLTPKKEEGNT